MKTNPIRFTGMASGIDTNSIIQDMLRPQQAKIDNQKREQTLIQLRQDAWKEMNQKLYDFHTKFIHNMSLKSTFNKSFATSSNENAISVINKQMIPLGTHLFEIDNVATATSVSGNIDSGVINLNKDTTVGNLIGGAVPEHQKNLGMVVNGKSINIDIDSSDTLGYIAEKINEKFKDVGAQFTARYDASNGMFFINSTKLGQDQTIGFDNELGSVLFDKLGLTENGITKDNITKQGMDANYKYNGASFTSTSNNIEINGIKATLKAANEGEVITISSEIDKDATYSFIEEFINEYNLLIEEINEKLNTKPGIDMKPLTQEDRKSMSESDIKLWDNKINNSLLYKDKQLESFVNISRNILGSVLGDGQYNSLNNVGITTGPWQEKGKLYITGSEDGSDSTNKLKAAISENPDAIIDLFNKLGKQLYEAHGQTLRSSSSKSSMNFYNDKIMDKQIKDYDKQIASLEEKMYRLEEQQYAKFAAMEQMLNSLNNQSSWLFQQFGGY